MVQTAAIIGSGNIGTDLMYKLTRREGDVKLVALVGIDPNSDGLAKAHALGLEAIHTGVDGLIDSPVFDDLAIVFDATSAGAHHVNAEKLTAAKSGIRLIDSGIGQTLPASCTGIGKALLSALPDDDVRELYADPDNLPIMTRQSIQTLPELLDELHATRARLRAGGRRVDPRPALRGRRRARRGGRRLAAISTSVPDVRWSGRSDEEWAAPVLAAAADLSAQLGYLPAR